ncbi:MAG TPA: PHB depolymerase family esterase [Caulobacteraceae bacterium]|nr:PHB depolymerase family esterase [Caulobacteraceae bacterium]
MGGANRSYAYFVSSKANSWNQTPIVFALHDNGQTAQQFAEQSGWAKLAEDNGFAVVFPEADKGTWSSTSGASEDYLGATIAHARRNILSRFPGDQAAPGGGRGGAAAAAPAGPAAPRPVAVVGTHTYLTGSGAGGVAAQEFAIEHPGMFAGVATLNAVPLRGAYVKGDDPADNAIQYQRGKVTPPLYRPLKREVPVPMWLFSAGAQGPGFAAELDYWKRSNGVSGAADTRAVAGLQTTTYRNPQNPAQQVRTTVLPPAAKYDEALASAIWDGLFGRTARWTSAPNGDLATITPRLEFERTFELRTVDAGGAAPFKYYVKLPSSYKKGQSLPLVISLHGGQMSPWIYSGQIRMHEVGEKEGFITVYPAAADRNTWTAADYNGPDAKGIEALVGDMVATYGVDRSRVYLHGFSVGSRMAQTTGLTRPQVFAAIAPTEGFPPFAPDMQARIAELKAKMDYRMPIMAAYASSDVDASPDGGKIPAKGQTQGALEAFKAYNHITTADRVEHYDSPYVPAYDIVVPQGRLVRAAVDAHYPNGKIQLYKYMSADPKPLELLDFLWVLDMAHSTAPQQAQLAWDYFKHWSRNPDGTLAYKP